MNKQKKNSVAPYLDIEQDLRDKIESGVYSPGEKLPTEDELSMEFSISRPTLRKALSLLTSSGYIYSIPGRGTFISGSKDDTIERQARNHRQLKKMNKGIGVLIPCITESLFPGILRGAEDICKENGYHVILGNCDGDPEKEREYMELFTERGAMGLIVSPSYKSHTNTYYRTLARRGIPLVLTDSEIEGIHADIVVTDNKLGGLLATEALIKQGCRKIAFISGWMFAPSSRERFSGYEEALEKAGLSVDKSLIVEGDCTERFGFDAAKKILSGSGVDAIFSANEPITCGAARFLREKGRSFAERIWVASFDEPKLSFNQTFPLILVRQRRYEIGKVAAQLLIERIDKRTGTKEIAHRKILVEPEKVEIYALEEETAKQARI